VESPTFDDLATRRVSFIFPTKDRVGAVRKALDAARELLAEDDELIIVDASSTDDVGKIVREYGALVSTYIREPDNSSAHAFNKGFLLARGRYIIHYADDDLLFADGVDKACHLMDSNRAVDLLICGGTKVVGGSDVVKWLLPGTGYGSSVLDAFTHGAPGVGFVIRRSSLPAVGMFQTRLSSDVEFAARIIAMGRIVRFGRINLYRHMISAASHVEKNPVAFRNDLRSVARMHLPTRSYVLWRVRKLTSKGSFSWRVKIRLRLLLRRRRDVQAIDAFDSSDQGDAKSLGMWDGGLS